MKTSHLGSYISILVTIAIVLAIIFAFFSLLLGGMRWIISGGDKSKVAAARSGVLAAIIGLVLVFLAYFILNIVLGMFGLSLAKLSLPTVPFPLR